MKALYHKQTIKEIESRGKRNKHKTEINIKQKIDIKEY